MSRLATFENFATPKPTRAEKAKATQERIEDEKLAAFDSGYKSGWDDAISAYTDGRRIMAGTLKDAISKAEVDLEAVRSEILSQIHPIFQKSVEIFCQKGALSPLANRLFQLLQELTTGSQRSELLVECSVEDLETLEAVCKEKNIETKPTINQSLAQGQFTISCDQEKLEVDFSEIQSNLQNLAEQFWNLHEESH